MAWDMKKNEEKRLEEERRKKKTRRRWLSLQYILDLFINKCFKGIIYRNSLLDFFLNCSKFIC